MKRTLAKSFKNSYRVFLGEQWSGTDLFFVKSKLTPKLLRSQVIVESGAKVDNIVVQLVDDLNNRYDYLDSTISSLDDTVEVISKGVVTTIKKDYYDAITSLFPNCKLRSSTKTRQAPVLFLDGDIVVGLATCMR